MKIDLHMKDEPLDSLLKKETKAIQKWPISDVQHHAYSRTTRQLFELIATVNTF